MLVSMLSVTSSSVEANLSLKPNLLFFSHSLTVPRSMPIALAVIPIVAMLA